MSPFKLPSKQDLPNNVEELKQLLIEHVNEANQSYNQLAHQLELLKKMVFGKKSERFIPDPGNQTVLPGIFEQIKPDPDIEEQTVKKTIHEKKRKFKSRPGINRNPFPEHLERQEVIVKPDQNLQVQIDQGNARLISYDTTQELCRRESLFVKVYKRGKYEISNTNSPTGTAIVTVPMPTRPIERSIAGVSLICWVILSKFADHMPLYRIQMALKRDHVHINRSTMVGWLERIYELLLPIYQAMSNYVKSQNVIHTDDTGFPAILKKNKSETKVGRIFVYIANNVVVYVFHKNKSRQCPTDFLHGTKGYLVIDGAANFNEALRKSDLKPAYCWFHCRKNFFEAMDSDPKASKALEMLQPLFKAEKQWAEQGLGSEHILDKRRSYSAALVQEFTSWCKEEIKSGAHTPQSPMGKALGYYDSRIDGFSRFLENGNIPMTNNTSERAIKAAVLGRKNSMFVSSLKGGHWAAVFYSLVETCKRLEINPRDYLNDVLSRVADHPITRVEELTPIQWKQSR